MKTDTSNGKRTITQLTRPLLGISACLLGQRVRFDGQHKLDLYLRDTLGAFVDYHPVCPEVECGLPIPREAMRLVRQGDEIRLMTQKSAIDITPRMVAWREPRLDQLSGLPLCGFVFKAKSPSSGMERVKIYSEQGYASPTGSGLFAAAFMERFPHIPVEEEGRLHDDVLRENFVERVFVYHRWLQLPGNALNPERRRSLGALLAFHASHKYLIMSHSPEILRELGSLVARGKEMPPDDLYDNYISRLMTAMRLKATARKHTNVLHHIMGYFKKQLTPDEKVELLEHIDRYHRGNAPLIVPITLIAHYVRRFSTPYLLDQIYLDPHPAELLLRNHV